MLTPVHLVDSLPILALFLYPSLIPRYCPPSYFPHSHFYPFLSFYSPLLFLPFTLFPLISLSPITLCSNLHILCFPSQTLPLYPYTYSPLFFHVHFPFLSIPFTLPSLSPHYLSLHSHLALSLSSLSLFFLSISTLISYFP